jgi:hypothetical protein
VAATALTTDGSITPVRDTLWWAREIGNAFIRDSNTNEPSLAGQSRDLAIGIVQQFSLDHSRPVTEGVHFCPSCGSREGEEIFMFSSF